MNEERYCVVVGGANMDILGEPLHVLSEMSSSPGCVSFSMGGVGRNIAENISRLGSTCYLIAPVGRDANGKRLIEESARAGVFTETMIEIPECASSSYLSIVDNNGEMRLAVSDMEILQRFSIEQIELHLPVLKQATVVVLDLNLSEQLLEELFPQLLGMRVFVDTISLAKAERVKPHLRHVHTLKPNLQEAEIIAGIKIENEEQDLPRLGRWFIEQGVNRVFISLGSRGLYYCDSNEQAYFSLAADRIVNVNGGGDALMAALAHCWLRDINVAGTCHFALASANLTLSSKETVNPELSEEAVYGFLETCKIK